ncbi:MAG: hypothetical protein WC003_10015 [Terrimicrobiaceae bacterium]
MIRVVFEPGIIQGRFIGEAEIAQVRLVLSEHGDWSRWRVSRHLARLWEWRSASGQLKDISRYNFTVAESTPLEINVAVDPEMLGKVFEELVTGRHEQGSYYTPKPIVAFMGRAALVEYLVDCCPAESRASLERFVHPHDHHIDHRPVLRVDLLKFLPGLAQHSEFEESFNGFDLFSEGYQDGCQNSRSSKPTRFKQKQKPFTKRRLLCIGIDVS